MESPSSMLPMLDSLQGLSGKGLQALEKQADSIHAGGFGPLLDAVYAAVSSEHSIEPLAPAASQDLAGQLQDLPQAGKLLPLLKQLLQGGVIEGGDPREVNEKVVQTLEQVSAHSGLHPGPSMATALQSILAASVQGKTAEGSEALTVAATGGKVLASANDSASHSQYDRLAQLIQKQLGVTEAVGEGDDIAVTREPLRNSENPGFDKLLGQFQQQVMNPEQRQAELAITLAALKRAGTSARPVLPESSSRLEPASVMPAPNSAPPAVTTASQTPALSMGTPLNQNGWGQELGERIQWLVGQRLQGAQIKLNPANLGPMEVRIQVQNDQASVQFVSAHTVVREALEAALPRLREMFDASGVELVDVDVSGQSFAEQQRTAEQQPGLVWGGADNGQNPLPEPVIETPLAATTLSGGVDLFV